MILKLIVKWLLKKSNKYINAIEIGRKIYVIDIYEYKDAEEQIKEWKNALNGAIIQGTKN